MDAKLKEALKRAKQILGEESPEPPEPAESVTAVFEKLVADAKAYLESNTVADDISIEIKFSKDDFEVCFERS